MQAIADLNPITWIDAFNDTDMSVVSGRATQVNDKGITNADFSNSVNSAPYRVTNSLYFDGTADTRLNSTYPTLPSAGTAAEFFIVTDSINRNAQILSQSGSGTGGFGKPSNWVVCGASYGSGTMNTGPVGPLIGIASNAINYLETRHNYAPALISRAAPIGNGKAAVQIIRPPSGPVQSRVNFEHTAVNGATPSVQGALIPAFHLGGEGFGTTSAIFQGGFCEILVFNHGLSFEDRQLVEGYLAWKWGMVDKLPNDHLYKHYFPGDNYIEGIVTVGGQPAIDATVRIYDDSTGILMREVKTGADGKYRLDIFSTGTVFVVAYVSGYEPKAHGPIQILTPEA